MAPTTTGSTTAPTTTSTTTTAPVYPDAPPDLAPIAPGTVDGEGHWSPAGRLVRARPAIWTTALRPPSGGNPVGIARLDSSVLDVVPYAGTSQPGGTWSNQGEIPVARRSSLVAAFNGGFQFGNSEGGFYADGHAQPALRDGAASLVVFSDGSAIVGEWGRDANLTPDVAAVRQNLTLLVDDGKPTPEADSPGRWGATITHGSTTARSAVGSDDSQHLYFVGGSGLTPSGLAAVLVAAGARRAMELDINPQWVLFASYTDGPDGASAPAGTKLLESMNYGTDHFFAPDWRDFVAVFQRARASTTNDG